MDLPAQTERNLLEHELVPLSARLLIAVSGGVDSMVLLQVLSTLAPKFGWRCAVAHFNHQLRGPASDADEAFVLAQATALQLPFHAGRGDVAQFARDHGISLEMAGRDLRHRFLATTALQIGCSIIALAHHADDQVETFWLRLLRGDAGPGLAGMRWQRPSPSDPRVQLIRPFLNLSKTAILAYATAARLEFREDASNRDPRFQRNEIRHQIVPTLEKYQPQLRDLTLRTSSLLRDEKDFLTETARRWLETKDPQFDSLHPALQREIVRHQLLSLQLRPTFDRIEELRKSPATPVTLKPGLVLCRSASGDLLPQSSAPPAFLPEETPISLTSPGRAQLRGTEVSWTTVARREPSSAGTEYFDADALGPEAILRHWQPGDHFQPLGNPHPSKLQDLFTNLKIPSETRRQLLLAVTPSAQIFWVEGLRISEPFKVTSQTRRVLQWTWRPILPSS